MNINYKTDALIIIDMQNDFAIEDGALYVRGGMDILNPIANMCSKFENLFFTQDNHPATHKSFATFHQKKPFETIEMYGHDQVLWPEHCIQGSLGCEIVEELWDELNRAKAIIRKGMNPSVDSYSAFRENYGPDGNRASTGFAAMLHALGFKRLFLVGLARDYCVRFSAEDAVAEGFETFIIDNLTKSVNPALKDEVTAALTNAGVNLINYSDIGL